jgi:DNA-binding NarL/FixJ family response regulator
MERMGQDTSPPITLLIVDDHHLFRDGLVHAFSEEPGMKVVAHCSDGIKALDLFADHRPDVVLMDVSMPRIDGVETTRRLVVRHPEARVLMLTSSEEEQDAVDSMEAGAAGYVVKTVAFEELLDAIREVHAGGRPVGEAVARRLARSRPQGPLSARELNVLKGLRDGLAENEIARRLFISERTTRATVALIKEKLAAATIGQVVARAYERGILEVRRKPADA